MTSLALVVWGREGRRPSKGRRDERVVEGIGTPTRLSTFIIGCERAEGCLTGPKMHAKYLCSMHNLPR
ncbi:cytochrome b6-f complex subunit PetN [Sphingomonas sp. LM7]|uniref:cytochrome b6-f complex subunit PetN n=1 Tax=Sphingomonas sp. LM7 TaxID=1938607 RepID=UPI003457A733